MAELSITPIYILLNAILIIALAYRIVRLRWRFRVPLGDGDNKELRMAMAAHSNAIENMPMALLIMLMVELLGGSALVLHITGILLTLGRVWHAWGSSHNIGTSSGRYYGTLITWFYIPAMATYGIFLAYF